MSRWNITSNTQIPQISRLNPGTTISFLKVRKNKEIDKSNFFEKLFGGQESFYTFIPYDKYELKIIIYFTRVRFKQR